MLHQVQQIAGLKLYLQLTLCGAGLFFESLTSCCGLQKGLVKRDVGLLGLPGELLGDATSFNGIIDRLQGQEGRQSTARASTVAQAAGA